MEQNKWAGQDLSNKALKERSLAVGMLLEMQDKIEHTVDILLQRYYSLEEILSKIKELKLSSIPLSSMPSDLKQQADLLQKQAMELILENVPQMAQVPVPVAPKANPAPKAVPALTKGRQMSRLQLVEEAVLAKIKAHPRGVDSAVLKASSADLGSDIALMQEALANLKARNQIRRSGRTYQAVK